MGRFSDKTRKIASNPKAGQGSIGRKPENEILSALLAGAGAGVDVVRNERFRGDPSTGKRFSRDLENPEDTALNELRAQYAALADSLEAPNRADYGSTASFDEAERQARGTYDKALPVIETAAWELLGTLLKSKEGSETRMNEAVETSDRAALAQDEGAHQLEALAAADLSAQSGGNAAGSLVDQQQFAAAEGQANRSADRSLEQEYLRDLARNEQASVDDRIASGGKVKAAALADAQNNLGAILNQIGLQKAEAQGQGDAAYRQDLQSYQQNRAQLQFDAANAEREFVGQREQQMAELVQLQNEQFKESQIGASEAASEVAQMAQELGGGDIGRTAQIANTMIQQFATTWANGQNPRGVPVDPMAVRAQVQAVLKAIAG